MSMDWIPAAIPDPPSPKDYVDQIFKKALAPEFPSNNTVEESFIDWGLTKDQEMKVDKLPDKEIVEFYGARLTKIMMGMYEEASNKGFGGNGGFIHFCPVNMKISISFEGKHKGKNMQISPAFVHGHEVFRCHFHFDDTQ
eukprot:1562865-Rhodomonas_salina.1